MLFHAYFGDFIENNEEFIEETGLLKTFRYNDSFLRPPLVSICKYDFE